MYQTSFWICSLALAMEIACAPDWLLVIERNGVKKPKILFFGDNFSRFVPYMRTFGEAGVVTIKGVLHPKPHDPGITCMFAGYCVNREGDCYKMYDPIKNNT